MPDHSRSSGQSAKPVKLRESCDSCLLAKVKCSKARPLCSRCLANGAPCDYSPSSRAGKRHRNHTKGVNSVTRTETSNQALPVPSSSQSSNSSYLTRLMYPLLNEEDRVLLRHNDGPIVSGVASPPLQDTSGTKIHTGDNGTGTAHKADCVEPLELLSSRTFGQEDFMESLMPMSAAYTESFADFTDKPTSPAIGMDQAESSPTWTAKDNPQNVCLSSLQDPSGMIPNTTSPSNSTVPRASGPAGAPPQLQTHMPTNIVQASGKIHQSCDCFAACLQVLQSLHNHSSLLSATRPGGPPFDIVLTINHEAIESCSTMLECTNCLNKSGRSISTMMLATIFGKVMSLYRAACFLRLGPSTSVQESAQLAFGAYTVSGENRQLLEIEILLLELRKVDQILKMYSERFRNSQVEKEGDESGVYGALTSYLEKNLQYIVDFLKARRAVEKR